LYIIQNISLSCTIISPMK